MSQWTETIEKNLIAMQQNAKKLAENYLERYNSFKNVTTYLNVPLLLLSALNAYVIYDADSYSRGVQLGSSATSLGIAIILSGEFLYMFRNKVENHFLKYKHFESLEQSISQTLSVDPLHRIMEAEGYLEDTFREYKTLVADDMFIMQYLGNLGIPEEINTEDIPAILHDHWNILFRPTFRRIKQKNQKVMEALKTTGQSFDLDGFVSTVEKEKEDKKVEMKKTFLSWLSAIRGKEKEDDDTTLVPIPASSDIIPVPFTMPVTTPAATTPADVESSFKEDVDASMVEMSNVYPETTHQKMMYEPIKRPTAAFTMSFSQKI
jgi:hypothetical protein